MIFGWIHFLIGMSFLLLHLLLPLLAAAAVIWAIAWLIRHSVK